jgi:hypothetical protein
MFNNWRVGKALAEAFLADRRQGFPCQGRQRAVVVERTYR